MGQKTNSNLLRLNLNKNEWKSKYFEKLFEESSLYIFNDLEIRRYINRFFQLYNLSIHSCNLQYSNNTLNIYISYFILLKNLNFLIKIKKFKLSLLNNINNKSIKKSKNVYCYICKQPIKNILLFDVWKKNSLNNYCLCHKKCKNLVNGIKTQNFIEILLESLNLFTKKNINIFIVFHNLNNLNKNLFLNFNRLQIFYFKKLLFQLRRFERNSSFKKTFFKETIIILILSSRKKKSAKLLSEFLSFQISKMKKHNLFFIFLKQAILLILKSNFAYLYGIKIVVNGKFNRARRARSRIIQIGNIPLQSFNFNIDYFQSVAYTFKGTFGIKVWICEKY